MRKLASLFPLGMRRRFLAAHLSSIVGDKISGRLRITDQAWPDGGRLCIGLERNDGDIWLSVNPRVLARRYPYRVLYARMPAVLRVFAGTHPSVRRVSAEMSDGIEVAPGALCFSSSRDDVLLIPDVYFINSGGFEWARKAAKTAPSWTERDDLIVWRGSATGSGALADDRMEAANDRLKQRVRLCLMLRNVEGVDAGIVKVFRRAKGAQRMALIEHRLIGRRIRERTWARRKFAIDIDGNTNSWSNFYVRLLFGCCVIKLVNDLKDRTPHTVIGKRQLEPRACQRGIFETDIQLSRYPINLFNVRSFCSNVCHHCNDTPSLRRMQQLFLLFL